jgi:flagellum-specific peptidoglycan hydrolase FlgJ
MLQKNIKLDRENSMQLKQWGSKIMKKIIVKKWPFAAAFMVVMATAIWLAPSGFADSSIKLIVDGKDITASAAPVIQEGRTLVPVRFVSEELGAEVEWNNEDRTVQITKGDRSVLLRIDSRLVAYENEGTIYSLCDVAPKIISERTFVPLRLVSNALGVGISWDDNTRTVAVNSAQATAIAPFFDMKISGIQPGQVINGVTNLQTVFPSGVPIGASQINYMLVSPDTAKGVVVTRGDQPTSLYSWLPNPQENGSRILIAAVYDSSGNFLAGDAVPVQMQLSPQASVTGVANGQVIKESVSLSAKLNFDASYVKYEIKNLDTNKTFTSAESDPQGPYNWTPLMEDNGNLSIKVTAYDQEDKAYPSQLVTALVAVERKLALSGVSAGKTIDGPVTLSVSRNFQVSDTEYLMRSAQSGPETILAKVGYVSYKWFPGPSFKGDKEVFVRVTDTKGNIFTSSPINVTVTGTPRLLLTGIGPDQVVTDTIKLKAISNVGLYSIEYSITNIKTGDTKIIANGQDPLAEYSYTPTNTDAGYWKIKAVGTYANGSTISSEEVTFRIYTNTIYKAMPITEKSNFLNLASELAQDSRKKTGMSAALQTAQAILETGWGQSVPVDKYNGQFSYNLFGIKGTGAAGSVTSNTWEEYNGIAFRIDAEFRAYYNTNESWADHKRLLLTASRYEPFRAVMHDSIQGAWALRRAGYATDSQYPLKLLNIIKLYDLQKLDQINI